MTSGVAINAGVSAFAGVTQAAGVALQAGMSAGPYAPQVATPQFSPAPGTYTAEQTVTLSCPTAGATIKYTVDGSTPTPMHGTTYTVPFAVAATATVKAIAYNGVIADSAVAVGAYVINLPPPVVDTLTVGGVDQLFNGADALTIGD